MYCIRCGVENPEDARLCRSCGESLVVAGEQHPAAMKKTSGYAIAALVLGILSPFTCMLTALPAIIFGIVALLKINNASNHAKGNGLAITGICLPAVLFPIMALMIGILMPALARTRQLAFRMTCGTNLSGLGNAMLLYANDHENKFPTPSQWCDLLIEDAAVDPRIFQCKGAGEGACHYAMNEHVADLGTNAPADMVLLFETQAGWNQVGDADILTTDNHQGDGCNVLFVDGHVEFVKLAGIPNLRWRPPPQE